MLEDRIACCHADTGDIIFLAKVHAHAPSVDAIVFSPGDKQTTWMEEMDGYRQLRVTQTGR